MHFLDLELTNVSTKIVLNEEQKELIKQATFASYPNEMCGFLTEQSFIAVPNIADDPAKTFKISLEDQSKWFKDATAIVHSHCRAPRTPEILDLRTPSVSDVKGQKATNIPWLIVGCESYTVSEPLQIPRVRSNEYLNRRFMWFVNDCYTLVQDWYYFELGITLKDYVLDAEYTDIRRLADLFTPYIADYGFVEVNLKELQRGDLLLVDNMGFANNHLIIYTGNECLHQDQLSVILPFETFYGRIKKVLRYAN